MPNPTEMNPYLTSQLTPLKKAIYEQNIGTINSLLSSDTQLTPDIIKLIYARHDIQVYTAFANVFPDIINLKVNGKHPPLQNYIYDIINHCIPTQLGFPLDTKEIANHFNARKDLLLYLWQQGANYNETLEHFTKQNNIAALVVLKYLQEHPQQAMTSVDFTHYYQNFKFNNNQNDNLNNNKFLTPSAMNAQKWPHMYSPSNNQHPSEQVKIDVGIKHGHR